MRDVICIFYHRTQGESIQRIRYNGRRDERKKMTEVHTSVHEVYLLGVRLHSTR